MAFSTLQDLNTFVSTKLHSELQGKAVSFLPIPHIPTADCGSDIFLQLAQLQNSEPQSLGERLLPLLDSDQFVVSRGYLNFMGSNDIHWILTPEPMIQKPACFRTLKIGVMAETFDALGSNSMQSIRIRCMVLFQIYLLLFVHNDNPVFHHQVELLYGSHALTITKENFFEISKKFLLLEKVSIDPSTISVGDPLFLHISPKGLTKKLYQHFIDSERSERYWLKFLSLERVFYNAPTLPWSSSFIESIFKDKNHVVSALFYLASGLQATELDDTVSCNNENANIFWWIKKILMKSEQLGITRLTFDTNFEITPNNRKLLLMLKFFNQYVFEAKYHGKFFDFTNMIIALLEYSESSFNHPTYRAALQCGQIPSDVAYILAGVSKRLELFSV